MISWYGHVYSKSVFTQCFLSFFLSLWRSSTSLLMLMLARRQSSRVEPASARTISRCHREFVRIHTCKFPYSSSAYAWHGVALPATDGHGTINPPHVHAAQTLFKFEDFSSAHANEVQTCCKRPSQRAGSVMVIHLFLFFHVVFPRDQFNALNCLSIREAILMMNTSF